MPRLMSVALTEQAVRERRKTVTRRLGWKHLKPGDELDLCRKVMGRRHGEPLVRLARVRVVGTRWEPLYAVTDADVDREGFGPWEGSPGIDWWPPGSVPPEDRAGQASHRFILFFVQAMGCLSSTGVNRIEWEYLPTPADWPQISEPAPLPFFGG